MWLVYTEQRALPEVDRSLLQGTLHRQQGIMLIILVGQGVERGQNGQNLREITVMTSAHSQVRSEAWGAPHQGLSALYIGGAEYTQACLILNGTTSYKWKLLLCFPAAQTRITAHNLY